MRSLKSVLSTILFISWLTGYAQAPLQKDETVPAKLKPILSADSKNGWHRFNEGITLDPAGPEGFFEKYKEAFELQDGFGMNLIRHTEEKELGMNHYRFQQTYKGIPIAGAEYILHQRDGRPLKGNGYIISRFSKGEKPSISGETALQSVLKQVNAKRYAWEDPAYEKLIKEQKGADATLYPQPKLIYYSATGEHDVASYQLAYEMNVYALDPFLHQKFFVSATTGEVIDSFNLTHETNTPSSGTTIYNGTQNFISDFTGSNYVLREANRNGSGTSIFTYDMNESTDLGMAVDFQNNSANWLNEPVGVQGHWSFEKTFDYYYSVHGRNSYDDNGGAIISYLDYGDNYNNASWSQDLHIMKFGSGDGVNRTSWASLDVAAHELTHGVTEHSAGLIYLNESGALNESFSDIFGAAVEFYVEGPNADWLVSEDVTVNGSGIRSMSNPNVFNDPDTYHGTFWEFSSNDNGGVHTNSGVQNHWFYLLVNGGSGTNDNGQSYSVTGIGMDMAAAIAYRNLTQYLTNDSRYRDAREGALEAAEDLFGRTSDAYAQTAMAWYAVGVGFPVYSGEDIGLRTVLVSGGSCDQLSLELVNLSTASTIPAGAVIDIIIKENNVIKPTEQIILPASLPPGTSITVALTQPLFTVNGKVDIEAHVVYTPDPETGNNISTASLLKGTLRIGGTSPDFTTIVQAVAALKDPAATICGHLNFKIRSGIYNGEVRIENIQASSSTNTVTFESETGNPDDVTIRSSITIGSAYGALNVERANGIRVKNLTVVRQIPSTISTATGVAIRGEVHDLVLEGLKIRCLGSTGPYRTNIEFQQYGEPQSNIVVRNNLLESASRGITVDGDEIDNLVIEHNRINNHIESMRMRGHNITIRNNKITTSNIPDNDNCVHVRITGELLFEGNDVRVNALASSSVTGLDIEKANYAKVYNNMINISSLGSPRGVFNVTVPMAEFYHNTIRVAKIGSGTNQTVAIDYNSDITASAIWNNILISYTNGALGIELKGQDILSNGNDFHFPNGFVGMQSSTKYATLTQWQNATGYDMNSTNVEPLFVSNSDLHLGSQQPDLRSIVPTILKHDIDGEVRFLFPNMGADDYFAPNTGDLAITSLQLLNQSSCNTKAIHIIISNTGSVPYAAGMQIPVSHRVNGASAATEIITLPENLPAGETIGYTFIQKAIFPPSQNLILSVKIDRPDANAANNESVRNITTKSEYTVGGTDPDFANIKLGLDFLTSSIRPCPLPQITFKIRPGVYPELVSISEIQGLSLVFESETGNAQDVVITSNTSSTVTLLGAKHVTFRNLSVEYLGTSASEAVLLAKNSCEDITITNCNLSGPAISSEHYAILSGPSGASQVNGLHLTHNVFTNGGIKMESNANVSYPFDNIQIDSNTFVNSYTHAISLARTGIVTVYDNIITSSNVSSGISITQPLKDVRVERNRVTLEAGVNGIYFYNLIPSFSRIYVFNNFVNLQAGAASINGITVYGKGGYIYHNTVSLSPGPVQPTQAFVFSTQNNGAAVRHNLLSSIITNAVGIDWVSGPPSEDYNNIYVPNGYTGRYNTQLYTTLADWQAATGLDLQSRSVEPLFVSANDLHLATYQPELRGSNVSLFPYVQIDIDGDQRTLPLYIGADEYIRPPYADLFPNAIAGVPVFGQIYFVEVVSNSDWTIVTPLPDGITIDTVTTDGFFLTVSANPLDVPRNLTVNVQTLDTPVGVSSLQISQEGPPALTATAGVTSVDLTWQIAAAAANYNIWFSQDGLPADSLLATVDGSVTSFAHTGLSPGTSYSYQLSVADASRNESAKSAAITVTLSDPFVELSPGDIPEASLFGGGYDITVASNDNWIVAAPVPSEVTITNVSATGFRASVSPNPLSSSREFFITIQTTSSPIATAELRILQDGPPLLTAQPGNRSVNLSWTPLRGTKVYQYKIYRVVKTGPQLLVTLPATETTYTNTGLTNGVTYRYQLSVLDRAGNESALSPIASATPTWLIFLGADRQQQILSLYPNPTEDKLSLSGQVNTTGSYLAEIINSYGLPAGKQELYLESGEIRSAIEVSKLPAGIYLLRVSNPSGNLITTFRFEKK